MTDTIRAVSDEHWVNKSPAVMTLAHEMIGSDTADPAAAQWLIHVVLALWCWPSTDPDIENEMIRRFLAPPFASLVQGENSQ